MATFRELFDAQVGTVVRTLRRLGVAERDLEDQAHEVFLVVHEKLATYDPSRPFKTWLLGICYRRAAGYRRLARHAKEDLGSAPELPDSAPSVEEHYADREAWTLLVAGLDALDPLPRMALVLHDLEGLTLKEVAEVTGAPIQTVYSRVQAARESLTRHLTRDDRRRTTR